MMKTLTVKRISPVSDIMEARLALQGMERHSIDCVNWPDRFPYKSEVSFAIAHSGSAIMLNFKVLESTVRAMGANDRDHIWEDSCVEFFLAPYATEGYYNFEFNSIGRLYSCFGPDRNNREFLPEECYRSIMRLGSMGDAPFDEKTASGEWELTVIIPVTSLIRHNIKDLGGMKMSANFYKCGDKLSTPHFISYAPVNTENPDFHRSEYFASVIFEK